MSPLRHGGALAIALLALAAALAGPVSAATFCVHQPGAGCGPGEIDKGSDLQGALTDALAADGPDAGAAVQGAKVTLAGGGKTRKATTGKSGKLTFATTTPGKYKAVATKPGYAKATGKLKVK